MQAVIIVAGKGTRMRPLTLNLPKPFLKVLGKSILERNLEQLLGLVDEVILVVGYRKEVIENYFGSSYKGMQLTYVWQQEQLGTGHAAKLALPHLRGRFLLMYGDDLYTRKDIEQLLGRCPSILLGKVHNPSQFGVVLVQGDCVTELVEKPENPQSNLVNAGLYYVDLSVFDMQIEKSSRGEYEFTDYIRKLLQKESLFFVITKDWIPIATPENLQHAETALLDKR
jgi:UDP-N-acetylglucosamine diphosphorylase / glucose-1-phosphate thymidylyltransferase / UDP-N-acetylgalactosamine diphosphorylase / glucosamine-1-phosphate N-acetyltransferase / galactosamine-1-phosphate N-acetyltransferase